MLEDALAGDGRFDALPPDLTGAQALAIAV
jgi:hypothetical protein